MGVSSVHSLPIPSGKSGQQVIEMISKQLESFGAQKCGQYYVECDIYLSVNQTTGQTSDPISDQQMTGGGSGGQSSRVLNLYHSSEYPMSCFALLDSGSSLVADSAFEPIIMNLSAIYSNKKIPRIDCRGQKWSLSDFCVRIGSCSSGPHLKGVLLEIEYKPSVVANHCWDLMKELASSLCGPQLNWTDGTNGTNQWMASKMNELYSPIDTIQQYNHHFNQLRKQTTTHTIPHTGPQNTQINK